MFAGNFAPNGWALCNGQLLPISENETLFFVLGTTYGGDGQATFALPDLRGRLPIHQGTGPGLSTVALGETGGAESHTLTVNQIPVHSHPLLASADLGNSSGVANNVVARSPSASLYIEDAPAVNANPAAVPVVGGSQPHTNFQPYLCINFIISLFGVFPPPQ